MARSDSEHDGRDDRVLRSSGGQDALLQVDSVDSVTPEDLVTAGLEDRSHAIEIPVSLLPTPGVMGLPLAPLPPGAPSPEREVEGLRDPPEGLRALDPPPHH